VMGENTVRSSCVAEKSPFGDVVLHVDECAGRDGVEGRPAA
jgi:hypothetical protein